MQGMPLRQNLKQLRQFISKLFNIDIPTYGFSIARTSPKNKNLRV